MGRPRRDAVDYFPHACHHGKTLYMLEQTYGNDGYAYWFKLLERLAGSPGHFIDCRGFGDWEAIVAQSGTDQGRCEAIMETLCKLGAIDVELWRVRRVVWVQNLTNALIDVYKKRHGDVPVRPVWLLKEVSGAETLKPRCSGISDPETPLSGAETLKQGQKAGKEKESEIRVSGAETPIEAPFRLEGGRAEGFPGAQPPSLGGCSISLSSLSSLSCPEKKEGREEEGLWIRKIWEAWLEAGIQDEAIVMSALDIQGIKTVQLCYPGRIERVIEAIATYGEILHEPQYILKTRWTLGKFLNEHLTKFFPGSHPRDNYRKKSLGRSRDERVRAMLGEEV